MAVFTTSDKLGQRPTVSAAAPIQGYNAGAPQRAAIDAAGQLRQTGKQIEQFGANITTEEERRAKEAQAEQEKQTRVNDAMRLTQFRSALTRQNIAFKNSIADSNDYQSFSKDHAAALDSVKKQFDGQFLTPEAQVEFETSFGDFQDKEGYEINQIVRAKNKDRILANTEQTKADNYAAMELANTDEEFNSLVMNNMELDEGLYDSGIYDQTTFGAKLRENEQAIADIWVKRQPTDKIIELITQSLSGGETGKSYVDVVKGIESGGNPNAKNPNSSAKGIYQWTDATARQYGLLGDGFDYRGDPEKEDAAFKQLTEDNRVQLYNDLGREPTDQELYLAHQQGASGAAKLILNPNANAVDVLSGIGVNPKTARDSIVNNGGNENMTAGEFVNKWSESYDKKSGGAARKKTGTPIDIMDRDKVEKWLTYAQSKKEEEIKAQELALELPKIQKKQNQNKMINEIVFDQSISPEERIATIQLAKLQGQVEDGWAGDAVAFINSTKPDAIKPPSPEVQLSAFVELKGMLSDLDKATESLGETRWFSDADEVTPDKLSKYEDFQKAVFQKVANKEISPSEAQSFLGGITERFDRTLEAAQSGATRQTYAGIKGYGNYLLKRIGEISANTGMGEAQQRDLFNAAQKFLGAFDENGDYQASGQYRSSDNYLMDSRALNEAVNLAMQEINNKNYAGVIDTKNPPNMVVAAVKSPPKDYPDARLAPDGFYYIKNDDGSYSRVKE